MKRKASASSKSSVPDSDSQEPVRGQEVSRKLSAACDFQEPKRVTSTNSKDCGTHVELDTKNSAPTSTIKNSSDIGAQDECSGNQISDNLRKGTTKLGRKNVMTVLRQSFRRSRKDRPKSLFTASVISPKGSNHPGHNIQVPHTSNPLVDNNSSFSVASVKTVRTLTPSKASIVSKTSQTSRGSLVEKEVSDQNSSPRRHSSFKQTVSAGDKQHIGKLQSCQGTCFNFG